MTDESDWSDGPHSAPPPNFEGAPAEYKAQICNQQQTVVETADDDVQKHQLVHSGYDDVSALHDRIAILEGQLAEQDRMIRHTLTMLIEWIEADSTHRHAA